MSVLWQRRLDRYPETRQRLWYLAIVVAATVVLYYELYVPGAVAPAIIAQYHMTFPYYVYISVVGNAIGAFSSLLAGLADRWGRANLVAYGLGVTGLITLFGLPNAPDQFTFGVLFALVSFVEGIILVATPALVRDFSPQLGRASAMGFWTLGPVVGSLVLSEVSSNTVTVLPAWQSQFVICGIVGLVVFVVALFSLRELSPNLRDQLMVSMRDRALVEARAAGIDVDRAIERPWRQMMTLRVIGSAFAISVFLIIYYTAVGFFTIYFTTIYGFSLAQANGIGNWFWGIDALSADRGRRDLRPAARAQTVHAGRRGRRDHHDDRVPDPRDRPGDRLLHLRLDHQRAGRVPGRRLRAVDGQLHRDRRADQSRRSPPPAWRCGAGRSGRSWRCRSSRCPSWSRP